MQGVMFRLLICSISMSVLALIYMVLTPVLSRHYSAKGRYYTWLIVVLGFIIPIRPYFNNAIVKVEFADNTVAPILKIGNKTPAWAPIKKELPSVISNMSMVKLLVIVWLIGMILVLAFHILRHYRYLKLIVRWSEDIQDNPILTHFKDLKMQMGLSATIGLQSCESIGSPMLIGFTNPRVLLPKTKFTKEELTFILQHELVHFKRKDLWYKALVLFAVSIHWFNPFVYLMAKAIDIQCELSCDEEVVRCTNMNARQYYCETIIGVIRYQTKQKTALSTNFYGGKKGMKQRIFSIMDMRTKKVGLVMLCVALLLILGTGYAFAAKSETQGAPQIIRENIKENIQVSPIGSYQYKFLPDPAIYSKYASYGITISDDGEMLLYKGERVRQFIDEGSEVQAYFLDEAGTLDLSVIRNAAGGIINIENISKEKAEEYRSDFFADEMKTETDADTQYAIDTNKYEQYSAYGIEFSSEDECLYYKGQRVKLFADMKSDGSFETFWTDEAGTMNVAVVRNSKGKITSVEPISEKKTQEYYALAEQFEQSIIKDLLEE